MVVRDAGAVALVADANEDGRFVMAETRDLRPMKLVACPECGHVADEEELRYVPRSYADPGYCDGCTTCIPHVEAEWEHPDI
jgi:MinD superfamily P-loop ATPase